MLHGYCLISLLHCEDQYPISSDWHKISIQRLFAAYFHINFAYVPPVLPFSKSGNLGSLWLEQWYPLGWSKLTINFGHYCALVGTIQLFGLKMELEGRFAVCAWTPVPFLKPNSEVLRNQWGLSVPVELYQLWQGSVGTLSLSPSHFLKTDGNEDCIRTKSVVQNQG